MSRAGIAAESDATRNGFHGSSSRAQAPAPANPTRPVPGEVLPTALSPSQPMNPESVLANQQRLRALENASVADAELLHDCRWKWMAARQRMANRRAEIERLRDELGVAP